MSRGVNKLTMNVWSNPLCYFFKNVSGIFFKKQFEVPPRFELGSLDSKSRVLTITPWDRYLNIFSRFKQYHEVFVWSFPLFESNYLKYEMSKSQNRFKFSICTIFSCIVLGGNKNNYYYYIPQSCKTIRLHVSVVHF